MGKHFDRADKQSSGSTRSNTYIIMDAELVVFLAVIGVCMAGIPREKDKRSPRACAAPCPAACAPACLPVCCVPAAPAPPPPPPPPPPCPAVCVTACVPACPAACCPQKKHR